MVGYTEKRRNNGIMVGDMEDEEEKEEMELWWVIRKKAKGKKWNYGGWFDFG